MRSRLRSAGVAATATALLLACASGNDGASGEDALDAAMGPTELLAERDGELVWSRFERCDVESADTTRDFLVHASAPADSMTLDEFAARASETAFDQQCSVMASSPEQTVCRKISAPETEVDVEIALTWSAGEFETRVVDGRSAEAASPTASRGGNDRCAEDTYGRLYCARSPYGAAVVTVLGRVRCARGQCAQNRRGEWRCSRAVGGWAEEEPRGGVQCERGCYAPSGGECSSM